MGRWRYEADDVSSLMSSPRRSKSLPDARGHGGRDLQRGHHGYKEHNRHNHRRRQRHHDDRAHRHRSHHHHRSSESRPLREMRKRSRSDADSRLYIVYPPEHSPSYGNELPLSFYGKPAGQMTLEHDDPHFVTYDRGFKTSSGPYWTYKKSGWPYNSDFGKNTAFTRQEFFNTMRQTHGGGGLNLRSMSSSSPTFVKRVN